MSTVIEALARRLADAPEPERLKMLKSLRSAITNADAEYDAKAVLKARAQWTSDGLEIDDKPTCSRVEDGTWVQAWVWVPKEDP